MPQNSIELLQKLMEKYSRVFMSFAGKQGVPYDDVEDIVMASFAPRDKKRKFTPWGLGRPQ